MLNGFCTLFLTCLLCFSLSIFANNSHTGIRAFSTSRQQSHIPNPYCGFTRFWFRKIERKSFTFSKLSEPVGALDKSKGKSGPIFAHALLNAQQSCIRVDDKMADNNQHESISLSEGPKNWQVMWENTKKAAMKGGMFGAVAGSIQVLSLMWMRTIINYQYRYGVSLQDAVSALYQEGGVLRFYRGIAYAIIQNPLSKFGAIAANEGALMIISQLTGIENASPALASVLGTALSVAWRLFLMPLETCKTILQVDGTRGMANLWQHILNGNMGVLYEGSTITMLATVTSHYPWFFVYNYLDEMISKPHDTKGLVVRSAVIGFLSSAVSDTVSNCLRVIKTVKQTMAASGHNIPGKLSYWDVVSHVYEESGWIGLVGRGLATRIVANGIQSVVFTVLWKLLPIYFAGRKERDNHRQ